MKVKCCVVNVVTYQHMLHKQELNLIFLQLNMQTS